MADTENTTEPTDEQVAAAARVLARSGVVREVSGIAYEALRAALSVAPSAPTEDDREALVASLRYGAGQLGKQHPSYGCAGCSICTARNTMEEAADELAARRSPVPPSEKLKRLDPDFRADLVDAARNRIAAVWADVPGGVDAETLAQNVVLAQEFFWLSRQFPVTAPVSLSEDVAKLIERLTKASRAVYLATDKTVADDLSSMFLEAAAALRSGAAVPVSGQPGTCDVCGKPSTQITTPGAIRFCDEHGGVR